MFEEGALLAHQVVGALKVSEMCLSQMRQHPFRRQNAFAQPVHFAWVADSGLDQGQVVVLFKDHTLSGTPSWLLWLSGLR